jgi:hypothetical protein
MKARRKWFLFVRYYYYLLFSSFQASLNPEQIFKTSIVQLFASGKWSVHISEEIKTKDDSLYNDPKTLKHQDSTTPERMKNPLLSVLSKRKQTEET